MPGLSQLKQFNKDLVSLGGEITIRASRGEKPVEVIIPKDIEDKNDSEDFVLGMPEIEAEIDNSPVDEDLSDLAGLASPSSANSDSQKSAAAGFEAPDLSGLLNPVALNEDESTSSMPDLSMFEDQPVEEESIEEPEEEVQEVSLADMSLDDLLSGAGFDSSEEETENQEDVSEPLNEKDVQDLADFDISDENDTFESEKQNEPLSEIEKDLSAAENKNKEPGLDDLLKNIDSEPQVEKTESEPASEDLDSLEDLDLPDDFDISEDNSENLENVEEKDSDVENVSPDENTFEDAGATEDLSGSLDDFELPDFDSSESTQDFSDENQNDSENIENQDAVEIPDLGETETFEEPESFEEIGDAEEKSQEESKSESIDELSDLGDLDSFDIPDFDSNDSNNEEKPESEGESEDYNDTPQGLFNIDDMDSQGKENESPAFNVEDDIPDYEDGINAEDLEETGDEEFNPDENEPLETFDTSEMEGMDFGIPDTDSQLDGSAGSGDFELGNKDEIAMEGEFEIPGFSDVDTAKDDKGKKSNHALKKEEKKKRGKKALPEADFSQAEQSDELPPNTLSDAQYKLFLKNLSQYPLNVRLAFEDLIVQNEFTDDAEFEVIEKILKKAPARQVASMLEKMLDISLPVPRDFEHRTAEQYEAYKKSLSYQLKNKIIPAIIAGAAAVLLVWGIFNFSKNCIYKPLKANSLYKQGYALLKADEYPQSQMKFDQAASYRINRKWFFKYARGYREAKQYQRAASMYEKILTYFSHDKEAGLEYADMELNDLVNYEKAEEIVRRQVLDYHINDADGILMLGDVFLEWGTEKDPSKLELAREQYATLIQLYKSKDLYLSRMMRYFIRTDNLRNVIQMQRNFEQREDSLSSQDWTELSGYLSDKYYGNLSPSEEYLRYEIEGLRKLLLLAVKTGPENPVAYYNLAKYFINSGETNSIESSLQKSIECFNKISSIKKRDLYKYIDAYRLLGEYYIDTSDYLQAQEQFAEGISLYTTERDNAGFEGNAEIGKLYEDMGNIKYTVSGDYDQALLNYKYSVELENDSPSIRYRIGYIQYKKKNYAEALGSFMKAGDGNVKERNLLLAMANTLSLRGDDYAAQGYYNQLIDKLDDEIAKKGLVLPQANTKDYDIVNTYLSAANNYGVTLYRLAKKTGNSSLNAKAIVEFQNSLRAWDALTRNQDTLVRLTGSNLAEQNIQYITHPIPDFEPAIYTDIEKTLLDNETF